MQASRMSEDGEEYRVGSLRSPKIDQTCEAVTERLTSKQSRYIFIRTLMPVCRQFNIACHF